MEITLGHMKLHNYQYLLYLSTWCMEMSKYLYLTKKYLVLTSNFQVLFKDKDKEILFQVFTTHRKNM